MCTILHAAATHKCNLIAITTFDEFIYCLQNCAFLSYIYP